MVRASGECSGRIAKDPENDDGNPPDSDDDELEYDVVGYFRWADTDKEGISRPGQQWVPVNGMCEDSDWEDHEDATSTTRRTICASPSRRRRRRRPRTRAFVEDAQYGHAESMRRSQCVTK